MAHLRLGPLGRTNSEEKAREGTVVRSLSCFSNFWPQPGATVAKSYRFGCLVSMKSDADDAVAECVADQIAHGMATQPLHDVGAIAGR